MYIMLIKGMSIGMLVILRIFINVFKDTSNFFYCKCLEYYIIKIGVKLIPNIHFTKLYKGILLVSNIYITH
jgi:hypothetical protein